MLQRLVIRHYSLRWQPIYTLQIIGCISLSKKESKMKNKAEFCELDKFTLQNFANKSLVKQPFIFFYTSHLQ